MAIQLKDRILTLCTTVGTNDAIVGETKEGYQGWEGITVGNTVYYCITDSADWEVGYGQYLSRAGTPTIQRNVLSSSNANEKLELSGNSSIFCTYPSEKAVFLNADDNIYYPTSNVTANNFVGKGNGITNINADTNNLAPEAPTDGETYARNNKTWVSISDTAGIPDAPVDGLMYGRKDGEWGNVADAGNIYTKTETNTLLDAKADKSTTYTKTQIDSQQSAQDSKIVINNDEIARQQIEITNNSSEIDKNTSAINTNITNISSNTTAIGTLSGQVANNSEDIAELQDSIFFSSAYSADYPSSPNRDPENGNMYLQKVALFTYSYADATQIFCSKTDESGNVRQFTAIQAGDSIVLNEVDSPNYGRYELVTVEDVSDSYVVMNVIPKKGQGTVITGVKVAFQAFPKPDSGTGDAYTKAESDAINDAQDVNISANTTAIADTYTKTEIDTWQGDQDTQISDNRNDIATKVGEAPEDGKQYARKDANWTEVVGGTLDIDALPALPTELEGTDLFVAERTGTNYKVTADELSLGTGGGGTTDILPILVNGYVNGGDGTIISGNGFTCVRAAAGKYTITLDNPIPENSVLSGTLSGAFDRVVSMVQDSTTTLTVNTRSAVTNEQKDTTFAFVVTGTETIAVGGGSGGGSYTPEPMVWENKIAERTTNTVYTNTHDVPIYVQVYTNSPVSTNLQFEIDGVAFGKVGAGSGGGTTQDIPLIIVPSGSTYQLKRTAGSVAVTLWHEARMPVAVGTGGKTVAFRANLSAIQTGLTSVTWTKVNLDTTTIDTDNAFADGKFQPNVAGYYQVNGAINQLCTPSSTQTVAAIYKNGIVESQGSSVSSDESYRSVISDVIYLNGTTDYLELYGFVESTGTCSISKDFTLTFLSAVLKG